ncbi:hypothetical protein V9T40_000262 [Parthenolecanium corni]|uniref:Fucosyltransferase n=1 Tax=Parthenolecanium corni TaxID=536013 RepID=A0AAN9TCZ4_9HEMI
MFNFERNYSGNQYQWTIIFKAIDEKSGCDRMQSNNQHTVLWCVPVVLWWTAFSHRRDEIRKCDHKHCFFTESRSFRLVPETKAFLFYGSDINLTDLPVPRKQEIWALFHEESLKNAPFLSSEKFTRLFNFTSTFDRESDLPSTTMHLSSLDAITDIKYLVPTKLKNELLESIAPIVYIQSSCDTLINRDEYVVNLSQYLKIDSFGKCLNNAELPTNLRTLESLNSPEFLAFLSRYKFTIAVENAVCDDYITEKLWRSLIVGSVPIYFGSPTIRDWLPNDKSVIFIEDFASPRDLADFIEELNYRDDLYDQYLLHKSIAKVDNILLKSVLTNRPWNEYGSLIEKFECDVCLALHEPSRLVSRKNFRRHFKCEKPTSLLTNEKNESNFWSAIFDVERCRGDAVFEIVSKNETLTEKVVEERVNRISASGGC